MRKLTFYSPFSILYFLSYILFALVLSACNAEIPGVVTITAPAPTPGSWTETPFVVPSPLPSDTLGAAPLVPLASPTEGAAVAETTLTPTPLPTDTPAPVALRPSYVIVADMDYESKVIDVTQEITYPNQSGQSLDEVILAMEPNLLDGVFNLTSVTVDEQKLDTFTLDGQKLDVTLPAALAPGATLKLGLTYSLNLPLIVQGNPNEVRPKIFGVADRQVNLVDWYPFIVPYINGGWVLHDPWYYGEHLVYDKADFDVTLRFKDGDNLPVVAASAAAEPLPDGGTRYQLENARNFSFSMGRQFKVVSQQIEGDITISNYYLGDLNKPAAESALDATVKSVKTYRELFGQYPHKTLAVVMGDFNDGMEFDGLYFLAKSFYNLYDNSQKEKNLLVTLAAHETAHEWWYGRVANDQAAEPWLDESLAMYCEKLFYENNYPDDLKWWWLYRVDAYQPTGWVDTVLYDGGGFTPYTNATYRMGAYFLEDLRAQIGDEAFFAFLKDYSTQMDGKISTSADFFRILRAHSDQDISALVTKYFQNQH